MRTLPNPWSLTHSLNPKLRHIITQIPKYWAKGSTPAENRSENMPAYHKGDLKERRQLILVFN